MSTEKGQADIDFVNAISGTPSEHTPSETVDATSEVPQVETPQVETPKVEVTPQINIETPFFSIKSQEEEKDLNDFLNLSEHIKSKYSADIKEPKDILGVLSKIDELSEKEQGYLQQINTLRQIETAVSSLPEDIKLLISDYVGGKDYKKTLNNIVKGSSIDFNKEASAYESDDLIRFYNDDLTKEELEDMDEKAKSKLYSMSLRQYNMDRDSVMNRSKQIEQETAQRKERFAQSIDDSIAELKRRFPEFKKKDIDAIKEKMISGYSLFDSTSSSYSKDAAVKIAMAEHGESALLQFKQSAEQMYKAQLNREVSKEREFYAQHQSDKPTTPTSVKPENVITKLVDQEVDFLSKKSNYI